MSASKNIFPAEVVQFTSEYHFHKYNPSTLVIYRLIVLLVILAIASLFFVTVDISVQSAGVIKSPVEHNEVKALVSGRVDKVMLKENMHVKAGQTLLTIKSEIISEKNNLIETQVAEFRAQIQDLRKLSHIAARKNWEGPVSLQSPLYRQQYALFRQRVNESANRFTIAEQTYKRNLYLFNKNVLTAAEFDQIKLSYLNAKNALDLIYEEQAGVWETDLNALKLKVQELVAQNKQNDRETELYTLKAPVTGTLQGIKGVQTGSFIAANDVIAEISPDSGLIAETYVRPKDIGLLKAGIPAYFQIDSYNYHEWGMLTGKIVSISNDAYTSSNQETFFKVRSRLDKEVLSLKNGYTGKIKKGMTLQARYFITRRTLFQLLYDKTDDWLNPKRLTTETITKG